MDKIIPDEETKERIDNLARVGTAIYEAGNESNYDTDFFLAKEALKKFQEGIERLVLEPETKVGIDNLIKYLDEKVQKRMNKTGSIQL